MQPRYRTFDHVPIDSESATVFGAAARNLGLDPSVTQFLAMRSRMVGSVGVKLVRSASGTSDLASDRGYLVNQRHELFDIMNIRCCCGDRQRNSLGIRAYV